MKICYLIPGALSAGPLGPAELERRAAFLSGRSADGTEIVVRDTPQGPPSIESEAQETMAAAAMLERLPEVVALESPDAVIIGCFGDPGLAAARELVTVPVLGPAQASMHLACQLGDRFGILSVVDEVLPTLRRLTRLYGLEARLASLRAVNVPVLELRRDRDRVLEILTNEGAAALDDGADALVLGCMSMGFLDIAGELQQRLQVSVINPTLAALHTAEAIVRGNLSSRRHTSANRVSAAVPRS